MNNQPTQLEIEGAYATLEHLRDYADDVENRIRARMAISLIAQYEEGGVVTDE